MLVIGVDAATWDVINPNIKQLPTFGELVECGTSRTITLKQKPWSPSVWCSMFSGKLPEEHGHHDFVKDGKLVKREDIKVEFIWDLLHKNGISVKAMNVPFIVPPYSYNVEFKPVAGGVPVEEHEILEEINAVTEKAMEVLTEDMPEVFIFVYTALDKLSHLHWGEPILLDYYKLIDAAVGTLTKFDDEVIVISDHGFCDYDKAPVRTLPKRTPKGEIKGDHHPEAILITKNVNYEILQPTDVFFYLEQKYLKR